MKIHIALISYVTIFKSYLLLANLFSYIQTQETLEIPKSGRTVTSQREFVQIG